MRSAKKSFAAASILALILGALTWTPIASGQAADTAAPTPKGRAACDITGTDKDDVLESGKADDVICGLGGDDTLLGNDGNDILKGGGGNDTLKGGEGNDDLNGGTDSDKCRQNDGKGKLADCEWPNPLKTCPVAKGETAYDDFGDSRGDHAHEGNDITAKKGTKVVAPFKGKATHLEASGAGLYVKVEKNDGSFIYGMHLDDYGHKGRVKAGEVIGYVGSTGNAGSINHLHFEWHPNGKAAVDPFPYLEKHCNTQYD